MAEGLRQVTAARGANLTLMSFTRRPHQTALRRIAAMFVTAALALAAMLGALSGLSPVGHPRAAAAATRATGTTAKPKLVTITIPARHGHVDSKWLHYAGPPRAQVMLPAGYDPSRRYPLLVALHGLNCDYYWFTATGLVKQFEHLNAIVVMPEGGSGWYTDWWNGGQRGNPSWETYFLDDVLPTITSRYPILPQRRYHALMGISMGGLGAVYLAGRLPGFFGSVSTLSGFVDLRYFSPIAEPAMGLLAFAPLKGDDDPLPVDGPPGSPYFEGHSPAQLVENLAHTRIFQSTGYGATSLPGLRDMLNGGSREGGAGAYAESLVIYPMNQSYHRALEQAGLHSTYREQLGGHDIPTFAEEIRAMLAWGPFAPVTSQPTSWHNDTIATHGQLWDLTYRFDRPPARVARFERSGSTLTISDAGSAVTIRTARGCTVHARTPVTITALDTRCAAS